MNPVYDRDGIRIFHGRAEEILPTFEDARYGIVFTSPPYNLGNSTGGGATYTGKGKRFRLGYVETSEGRRNGNRTGKTEREGGYLDTHDDNMPHDEYRDWQREILAECWRVIRPDGAIYYNHKPRILYGVERWPTEFIPEGLPIRQTVIWHRGGGVNVRPFWYVSAYEVILIIAGPEFQLTDHDASAVGDVWSLTREIKNHGHPAPFPVALPMRALRTAGKAPALDPFSGIGSTLIAAKRLGIPADGIEVNAGYIAITIDRLEQVSMRLPDVGTQPALMLE